VWDTLIYRDSDTGEYKGNLAIAWRRIDDRTLELDLRQGVKFHNGEDFDADDVVYTLNFISSPESKVATVVGRWIDHVEKLGKYRIRIVAKQSFPQAIAYLAGSKMAIHPHEYYAEVGAKGMNERPIGTGPYRVIEHALGKYIRLERNPDYFSGSPKPRATIDKVEIRFIPDPQTRVAEIVSGGIDLLTNVARDQAEQLRSLPALEITSGESVSYSIIRMNTLTATPVRALRDLRVRQAIAHAIDRETLVKFLIGEDARLLDSECHPTEFGCTAEGVPHYSYDPAKARQLLSAAGYPNGFDLDIYAWRERTEAEAVAGYLAAVGIRARLRFLEQASVTAIRRAGRVGLMTTSWGSTNYDASGTVSVFHTFSIDDMNRDPEVRDLLLKADSAMDPEVRKESYAKALKLNAERAYVVPLYSLPIYYIAAKDLVFKPTQDGTLKFYEMSWK
jgi:peptide/nickel transport system substrate-binding protein